MAQIANNERPDLFFNNLASFFNDELTKMSSEIVERHMKEIREEIEKERAKIIATAGINIAKNTSIEYGQDKLVITINDKRER